MTTRETVTDIGAKAMNAGHKLILKVSRGRVLSTTYGMQVLELATVGRKSGQRRVTMLTAPLLDDKRVVLVASKGGDDRHPDWYRNLVADPNVEVRYGDTTRLMTAHTASADEKAELWPQIVAAYKGYAGYQQRTDRDIPVVICEDRT